MGSRREWVASRSCPGRDCARVIAALFFRGPSWDDSQPIVGQKAFQGHLEWVSEHRDGAAAKIVEVAPFHDPGLPFDDELIGLALLDVESVEAARTVVELDPLVASGAFEYRLYDWRGESLRR
jgi:hypothetical protein